jgi:hypothetical protein
MCSNISSSRLTVPAPAPGPAPVPITPTLCTLITHIVLSHVVLSHVVLSHVVLSQLPIALCPPVTSGGGTLTFFLAGRPAYYYSSCQGAIPYWHNLMPKLAAYGGLQLHLSRNPV